MDDGHVDKRANKCIIKQEIKFKVYKIYLENNKIISKFTTKVQESKAHNVFKEKVNKIVLSVNNDKRIQTPDGVATYSLGNSLEKYAK